MSGHFRAWGCESWSVKNAGKVSSARLENSGDLEQSPGGAEFGQEKELIKSLSSEAAISFRGTNLWSLEISSNSVKTPGPTYMGK